MGIVIVTLVYIPQDIIIVHILPALYKLLISAVSALLGGSGHKYFDLRIGQNDRSDIPAIHYDIVFFRD